MKAFLLCMIICFANVCLLSQSIRVLDNENFLPIKNAVVYSIDRTKSGTTDNNGYVNISNFNIHDTIIIQHVSFKEIILPYSSIVSLNYVVRLDKKLIDLSEVVIAANKWEQNKNEVPNKINSINYKQVEIYDPQTTADMLNYSNEVFVQKSQLGGGSPMIRGFSANSVLLVVDGMRMNNAIYRSGNLHNIITLDPNIIESAEIVFGPGSIIYGSDALGGVMDFHTKRVLLSALGGKKYTANILNRFSTANNEKAFHTDINYHGEKWGWLSSVSLNDFGDLRQGSVGLPEFDRLHYIQRIDGVDQELVNPNPNIQKQTAYQQLNFLQKIRYRPTDNYDLNYIFYVSTSSDIPRYDRLIQTKDGHLEYSEWYYGPQYWLYHALNTRLNKSTIVYDDAKINFAYQNIKESRYSRKFGEDYLKSQIERIHIFSLNIDFNKTIFDRTTLFYGVETLYNNVNSHAFNENILNGVEQKIASRYPDGGSDYYTLAVYSSFKSNFSNKFTLTGGLRYSLIKLNSRFKDKSFFDFPYDEININNGDINASLGLVYRNSEFSQINLNFSSGFRAPNVDDVAKVFDSSPGNVVMPNENLKPEKAYNIDLGYVFKVRELFSVDVVVFYTYLHHAMVRRDFTFNGLSEIIYDGVLSKVQAVVNAGSANIYGGSFALNLNLKDDLKFHSNITYTRGQDDDGFALRHVPPLFGNTGFIYQNGKFFIDFFANYNGKVSFANLSPTEKEKPHIYAKDTSGNPYSPPWFILNLKTVFSASNKITLNVGIENIFDKRYRPYSSGISSPGRNLYVSLRLKY